MLLARSWRDHPLDWRLGWPTAGRAFAATSGVVSSAGEGGPSESDFEESDSEIVGVMLQARSR